MLGSYLLTSVRGVPIRIHVTAFFLIPWVYGAVAGMGLGGGMTLWITLLFITFLLTSVALHELGHTVVAQRYHMRVQDIVLTPIGGVARLRGAVENPRHEIRIALAGPYVSLLLAVAGLVLSRQAYAMEWMFAGAALQLVAFMNGMLFAFNLLPCFPMDGGRVLRGVLAQRKGMLEATRIAAGLGKSLAVLFFALGLLLARVNWIVIGIFIFLAAGSELRMMQFKAVQDQMQGGGFGTGAGPDLNQVEVSPPPYAS